MNHQRQYEQKREQSDQRAARIEQKPQSPHGRSPQLSNEVPHGVAASVTSSLGRYAAHTGQETTYDEFLNSETELVPNADKLTLDGPSPLPADKDGKYPIPMPGICTKTEYPIVKA